MSEPAPESDLVVTDMDDEVDVVEVYEEAPDPHVTRSMADVQDHVDDDEIVEEVKEGE